VYDVDSRPSSALIGRTLAFAAQQRATTGEWPAVLQQSARFTTSGTHPQGWQRAVCRGAAQLQTLWTLRREIPSFRRYARAGRDGETGAGVAAAARGLAQTVGHGLLVHVDVFRASGGLPVYTVLDDFPFGYRLSVEGIDVQPVPYTTLVPAPEGVRELIAQGQRWFHNYLDYPRCAENARAQGHGTRWTRLIGLAVGGYRGATWLLRSPGMAASLALLVGRAPWPARMAAAVSLGAGVVVPVWTLARAEGRTLSLPQLGREAGELVLATLLSSTGPAAAIVERVRVGAPDGTLSPKTGSRATEPGAATT
jgi:Glycosyl transferase family group 2